MNEDAVLLLGKLMGLLDQLMEERGVPAQKSVVNKNVIKTENSTLDEDGVVNKSALSSSEKKRLKETFTLFNEMFFDYSEKMKSDTKEQTLVSQIAQSQKEAHEPPALPDKKSGSSLMSMIIGGLTLLAASVGGIIASLSGFFGEAGSKVLAAVSKLGFIGALKIMSKTILKRLSISVLKRLPIIGGLISLGFAYQAFQKGDIFKGIAELIVGLLNFVPVVGPLLSIGGDILIAWAEKKGMFDKGGALSPENGWNTIKGWMKSIGNVIAENALYLPIIGTFKRFSMAYDSFKSGNIGDGLKQIGLGLITFWPGGGPLIKGLEILAGWMDAPKEPEGSFNPDRSWFSKMKDWIKSKLEVLPDPIKWALRWFGVLPEDDNSKPYLAGAEDKSKKASEGIVNYVTGVWDNIKKPMGDAASYIGDFAADAWEKTKNFTTSAWDKAKEAGSWFSDSIKSMAEKTKNVINEWIPSIVETISNIAGSAMETLKNIASKIGGWIAGLFSPEEEKKLQQVNTKAVEEQQNVVAKDKEMSTALLKGSNIQNTWSELLYKSSQDQVKLLGALVNIGGSSLAELKRISGNSGGGSVTVVSPQQSSKQMVTIPNNRDGYLSSPYAIG